MAAAKSCPYCGHAVPPGAAECPSCRFPDLDAGAPKPAPSPSSSPSTKDRKTVRAAKKARSKPPPETCAHCGASFPAGRAACPQCGSDADTGWKSGEDIDYASVDLPEDDPEAYREALLGERPHDISLWGTRRVRNLVIGALLLAAMVVPLLLALRHLGTG